MTHDEYDVTLSVNVSETDALRRSSLLVTGTLLCQTVFLAVTDRY
jgi:hypothetical protein